MEEPEISFSPKKKKTPVLFLLSFKFSIYYCLRGQDAL